MIICVSFCFVLLVEMMVFSLDILSIFNLEVKDSFIRIFLSVIYFVSIYLSVDKFKSSFISGKLF